MKTTRFVLDALRYGPIPLETLFADAEDLGLTRDEVSAAAVRLNIFTAVRRRDGILCAIPPDNVAAIWWSQRPHANRFCETAA